LGTSQWRAVYRHARQRARLVGIVAIVVAVVSVLVEWWVWFGGHTDEVFKVVDQVIDAMQHGPPPIVSRPAFAIIGGCFVVVGVALAFDSFSRGSRTIYVGTVIRELPPDGNMAADYEMRVSRAEHLDRHGRLTPDPSVPFDRTVHFLETSTAGMVPGREVVLVVSSGQKVIGHLSELVGPARGVTS
jgi:hypothetical protein